MYINDGKLMQIMSFEVTPFVSKDRLRETEFPVPKGLLVTYSGTPVTFPLKDVDGI